MSQKIKKSELGGVESKDDTLEVGSSEHDNYVDSSPNSYDEDIMGSESNSGEFYNMSSADEFMESFIGRNVDMNVEEVYYDKCKSMMNLYTYGDTEILEYPDGGVYSIQTSEEVDGGKVDETKYNIEKFDDYTTICIIGG